MPTTTDFLWLSAGSGVQIGGGFWVRLRNNDTATDYYSTAVSDAATGAFTHSAVPGDYSMYWGTAATVLGTPNLRNAHYKVPLSSGDDAALKSATMLASGPYTPGSPTGSSQLNQRFFTASPIGGGSSDTANVQAVIDRAPSGATIEFQPGLYTINGAGLIPKSGQAYVAARGSVTLQRTTVGDIFVSSARPLDSCTFEGLNFDLTNTGWSAIDFIGSDANGQITNLTIRDCYFKRPSTTWMIQIQYSILDPVIPTLKNRNIRMEDCYDDATGGTISLENIIFINCQDVVVQNCRFLNTPVTLAAHVAVYGYCRNVRFINNYIENWLCPWAVYVVQSDSIQFIGDNFRTTATQIPVEIFNCKDVAFIGGTFTVPAGGGGIQIHDFSGATFDGHTNLYSASSGIHVQGVRFDGMDTCVSLNCDQVQGQSDIFIESCLASPLRQLFSSQGMPASPSASVKRVFIRGNHVISHSAVSPNNCIDINGNASATNGGWQTVVIADNFIPASGSSGGDISVQNLADDVTITGNRCMSPTPISVPAAVTKLRITDNVGGNAGLGALGIMTAPNQTVGATALIASVTALTVQNDGAAHTYRVSGGVTITTLGSGSINLTVTYRDAGGNNRTQNIPLSTTAGTWAAAATTADDWHGSVIIQTNPVAAITVATAGTFTGCTYNAFGMIEQLR